MYIAAGEGQTTQGTKCWCQQKPLVTLVICHKFKKTLSSLILYTFFMILYMYIAPGQGLTAPWEQNFDVNRNILSLRSFIASFRNISLTSDFMQFFHYFIHVYSPRAEGRQPLGNKVLMSTEISCHFIHLFQVSKICLWSLILFFFSWFNTYI